MSKRVFSAGAPAVLLLTALAGTAAAQNRNAGEIRGTVSDTTAASVPGVSVSITNVSTGVTQQFTTNAAGVYVAPAVLAGNYTITFVKEGFRRLVRSGVSLSVQTITVDAQLEVGQLTQEVSVNAAAPLVQTESAERSTTLQSTTIKQLPLVGRNSYALTGILPGVNVGSGNNASGDSVGFNGTASYQGNFTIDGGSAVRPTSQNLGTGVPLEAIEEMNFRTSNFGAEYGNGVAVVSIITKSGTNIYKGSLFEYLQNNAFNARNFFLPTLPVFRWHQFGGTIGGPIIRDKTFFFFSYQTQRRVDYTGPFLSVPTQAMRNGDFSGMPTLFDPDTLSQINGQRMRQPLAGNRIPASRIDTVAKNMQEFYALPNLPGTFRNYYAPVRQPVTNHWYNGKVDHNLSSRNRLTGSVMYQDTSRVFNGPMCPVAQGSGSRDCTNYPFKSIDSQITDVWTMSPALINEIRVAFNRNISRATPPTLDAGLAQKLGIRNMYSDAFPNVAIGGPVALTSIGSGLVQQLNQNSFVYSDVATWVKGKHIVKAGGEFDRFQVNQAWDNTRPANLTFNGIYTRNPSDGASRGQGYADFLFGLPQNWTATKLPLTGARGSSIQMFVQDDYKILRNLTLSLGIRWMIQPSWTEHHGRLANFDPGLRNPSTNTPGAIAYGGSLQETNYGGIAPRLGFAWSPSKEWAIRGGYGLFNVMNGANTFAPNIGLGWTVSGFATSNDNITPIFQLQNGLPNVIVPTDNSRTASLLNGQNLDYLARSTPLTKIHQYQLGFQRQLPGAMVVDVAYVGTKGRSLGFGRDLNQVPASQLGPGNAQLRRRYPQFANINTRNFDGISNYDSLQVVARKQFSRGLTFQTTYTLSKALDTGAGSGNGGTTNVGIWQIAESPMLNYALSALDSTHLFNGAMVWELPVGRNRAWMNRGGLADCIVGGWQLAGIWQVRSGTPFTPVVGTANLSGALSGTWLPNRVGNGTLENPTIARWFDTSAFVAPAQFTFGNAGRSIVRGPGFANLDMSLSKEFSLAIVREAMSLQIRVDAANVLNHPNFGQPNAGIGAQGAGGIFSALAPRSLQLGARLLF